MMGFRCEAGNDRQMQADGSLDVCCDVERTGACDPTRKFVSNQSSHSQASIPNKKRQELDPLYGPQDLNGCPTLGVQFRISGRDLALWKLFLLDGDCWTLT